MEQVRPDLFWEQNQLAVEVQYSPILLTEFLRRNEVYLTRNIKPLWIFALSSNYDGNSQLEQYCKSWYGFIVYYDPQYKVFIKRADSEKDCPLLALDDFISIEAAFPIDHLKENHSQLQESIMNHANHQEGLKIEKNPCQNQSKDTKNSELKPSVSDSSHNDQHKQTIQNRSESLPRNSHFNSGFCIRCAREIFFDLRHPYCPNCYYSWVQYQNPEYEERYCHSCGKFWHTTINKPQCRGCFNNFKYFSNPIKNSVQF